MKFLLCVLQLWLFTTVTFAADTVGFRQIMQDTNGFRALPITVWYPATAGENIESVGENAAFYGERAIRNAEVADGKYPLVVLSHGYSGSWRNLGWLAATLVRNGYIVAAPDHPGTTTFDRNPVEAAKLRERPRDLGRVIDLLLKEPLFAGRVDRSRIAAIGHSLGGWTVSALAGARFDRARFKQDCSLNPGSRACALTIELGLNRGGAAGKTLESDLSDPRIKAVVSLDLGLARGFTPESLSRIKVPFLVIAAGTDIGDMPAKLESGYLAAHLPKTTSSYAEIPDAMHFSFMQLCKPGAMERIEAETPGDGVVCKDGGTRSRDEIHREVADRILAFLARAMPPERR